MTDPKYPIIEGYQVNDPRIQYVMDYLKNISDTILQWIQWFVQYIQNKLIINQETLTWCTI
jgi:hypothetical protein